MKLSDIKIPEGKNGIRKIDWLAQLLYESAREVINKMGIKTGVRQNQTWKEIPETEQEGWRSQARQLLKWCFVLRRDEAYEVLKK